MYKSVTTTAQGFVQQLAVSYLKNGYWFYVAGHTPARKSPEEVDEKLLSRYGIAASRWAKARARKAGGASLQYLRHGAFYLVVATHGRHDFFEAERSVLRDARREPVTCFGYSISHRGGHSHVRIEHNEYLMLKDHFLRIALRRRPEAVAWEFKALPFEPYAPVRRQLLALLRAVNKARKRAGLRPVEKRCLRLKRKIYRPFGEQDSSAHRRVARYMDRFPKWAKRGKPRYGEEDEGGEKAA